jgi:hypothetical protein
VDDEKRLKLRNFRMNDDDWQNFRGRRLQVGSGIGMVLVEYMTGKKLLK